MFNHVSSQSKAIKTCANCAGTISFPNSSCPQLTFELRQLKGSMTKGLALPKNVAYKWHTVPYKIQMSICIWYFDMILFTWHEVYDMMYMILCIHTYINRIYIYVCDTLLLCIMYIVHNLMSQRNMLYVIYWHDMLLLICHVLYNDVYYQHHIVICCVCTWLMVTAVRLVRNKGTNAPLRSLPSCQKKTLVT